MNELTAAIEKLINSKDFNELALMVERECGRELANVDIFNIMVGITTIHYAKILDKSGA